MSFFFFLSDKGLTIDKSARITNVKDTSALKGQVFVGEQIIKLDGKEVDGMTSASFADYIASNSHKERVLTVTKPPPEDITENVTVIAPAGKLGKNSTSKHMIAGAFDRVTFMK
jgi:C-terminal processing protease CtpA/Prc